MDWFEAIDNYCERTGPGYWSEPVNALSNAAFLVAALWAWRMAGPDRAARALAAILFLIGIGSWLFHTHARIWAALADVIPIQIFILGYVGLATVRFFRLPWWTGLAAVVLFFPYATAVSWVVEALFGRLNGSVEYVPVPILIAGYAWALRERAPETARGLAIGAAILVVSLFFRTIDEAVCAAVPLGTHFLWHVLNGVMLYWMIRVAVRHGRDRPVAA